MDEKIAEQYRKLVQQNFPNSGEMDNPTMFIDTKAEGVSICGQGAKDFMNIYLAVNDGIISDVKYLCICDPTANVVVEGLASLAKGKTLAEAKALTKEQFYEVIGTQNALVRQKVWGTIELLNRIINRWETRDKLKPAVDPAAAAAHPDWDDPTYEPDW
jgi:NifU-like protein involved in Fe-S cluster formation